MTGKRCCSSHEVYARMKNGERFTRDHMPGVHDAADAERDEILAAETRGTPAGIDPSAGLRAPARTVATSRSIRRVRCARSASWTP